MYQHKLLYVEFKNTKKYLYKGAWHFFANLPSIGLFDLSIHHYTDSVD